MSTEGRLFREAERAARSIVSVLQNRSSNGESMEREAPRQDVTPLRDGEFKVELAAVIPQLRAFARGLCGNRDAADDLVQEAMLRAWSARKRFEAGTSMMAWTHTILRNIFRSQMRRSRFIGEWDEARAEEILSANGDQEHHMDLSDLQRALLALPPAQREALILVGAGGFAYEEAAEICGCAIGTVKSRVARARMAVEHMLVDGHLSPRNVGANLDRSPLSTILREVDHLSNG